MPTSKSNDWHVKPSTSTVQEYVRSHRTSEDLFKRVHSDSRHTHTPAGTQFRNRAHAYNKNERKCMDEKIHWPARHMFGHPRCQQQTCNKGQYRVAQSGTVELMTWNEATDSCADKNQSFKPESTGNLILAKYSE